MKKILLVIALTFAMFACGNKYATQEAKVNAVKEIVAGNTKVRDEVTDILQDLSKKALNGDTDAMKELQEWGKAGFNASLPF